MKYKIGDKVRVRKDLIVDKEYGRDFFVSEMNFLKGKTVIISDIEYGFYKIIEDSGKWNWTDEMFSGKASEDFIPKESIQQNTLPEEESSYDIITVKTTKLKLYF